MYVYIPYHYTNLTVVRVCVRTDGGSQEVARPRAEFCSMLGHWTLEATKMGSMRGASHCTGQGKNVSLLNELLKSWATLKAYLDIATDGETAGFMSSC